MEKNDNIYNLNKFTPEQMELAKNKFTEEYYKHKNKYKYLIRDIKEIKIIIEDAKGLLFVNLSNKSKDLIIMIFKLPYFHAIEYQAYDLKYPILGIMYMILALNEFALSCKYKDLKEETISMTDYLAYIYAKKSLEYLQKYKNFYDEIQASESIIKQLEGKGIKDNLHLFEEMLNVLNYKSSIKKI